MIYRLFAYVEIVLIKQHLVNVSMAARLSLNLHQVNHLDKRYMKLAIALHVFFLILCIRGLPSVGKEILWKVLFVIISFFVQGCNFRLRLLRLCQRLLLGRHLLPMVMGVRRRRHSLWRRHHLGHHLLLMVMGAHSRRHRRRRRRRRRCHRRRRHRLLW